MIRFNNDYNHGALDSILSALTATNTDSFAGYGEDIWCRRAETVIKQLVSSGDALIKFVPGATQANLVVIAGALSPIQSVIAADTGHINCHEAAAIPLNRIVLETDCPYMSPEPFRGKRNDPGKLYRMAERLAEIRGISVEEVRAATMENGKRLYRI